jgi:superfamily II DNA/RNA helicase
LTPTFAELGVSPAVVSRLSAAGIEQPFAIQVHAIPAALAGRDVSGKAPTGSGKTLAFGIPVAERVERAAPGRPTALVLAPTRELASQIMRELKPLLRAHSRTVAAVYGGVGFGQQVTAIRRGVDVLVACPGRLADLVRQRVVSLADVRLVVLDEADRMADMGFLPEVRRLLDQTADDRQTLLFSATLDGDVDVLVRHYQSDPVRCEVEAPDDGTAAEVRHEFLDVAREDRVITTAKLVVEHGSAVVFCRTKHGADRVARQLTAAGITSVAIHGNRSQGQRDRAIQAFASGRAQALVATDVAARGIHVDGIGCVVHFDLPPDPKDYIHRSGRTGRAGAAGVVVSLVTPQEHAIARMLQRELGFAEVPAPVRRARPQSGRPQSGRPPAGRPRGRRRGQRRSRA